MANNEVWHIDALIERCGYFTSDTTVNNGYGCRHPKQEDVEDEYVEPGEPAPKEPRCGRCFTFTCPIAAAMDPNEPADAEEFRRHGLNPDDHTQTNWMLVALDEHGDLIGRREEVSDG